jgi:hemerythrin-like metal-binding protein
MAFIEWTGALSVGIDEIDGQHKGLVAMINDLATAVEEGKGKVAEAAILERLAAYTVEHFSLEERLFAERGYPAANAHKAEHDNFVKRVEAFRADHATGKGNLDGEMLFFLRSWLTNHISFSDKKYRPFLARRA